MFTSDHVTKMAVTLFHPPYPKTPCYTQILWLYVLCTGVTAAIGIFDLDLDSMTFIYELDPYDIETLGLRMCKCELHTSRRSKV